MRKIGICLLLALALAAGAGAREPAAGYVALTFDDGPSGPITLRLLDGLRARQAHATFFLCGYRMEEYPAPLGRYLAEGHELGVHSTAHVDLTRLAPEALREDLDQTARAIYQATGVRPRLMRPPGGAYNAPVLSQAEALGLGVVLWSVDTRDWACHTPEEILAGPQAPIRDGDVILMHDMSDSSVQAALTLIDRLQAKGFEFVTVSELAALRGRRLEPGAVYRNFRP